MLENFRMMILGGFHYGILFIGGSIVVTMLLNRVFYRLYLAPLIINAFSALLLIAAYKMNMSNMGFALYFNYMPVVSASILCNLILFTIKKLKLLKNSKDRM